MSPISRDRLAIFARVPVLGRVKTRLAKTIGAESALRVYEALLATTLQWLPGIKSVAPEIWVDGDPSAFVRWQRHRAQAGADRCIPLLPQGGGNLGQRMFRAFDQGVRVLVGTDIPDMSATYVEAAVDALRNADLVLGPTEDGGYCLIGMNSARADLFDGIPWGTPDVLTATLHQAGNLRVELLDELWDLDDADDLARWRS